MKSRPNFSSAVARVPLVVVLTLITACSTQVQVASIDGVHAGDEVNGLPFRAKQRYQVTLYHLENGKYVAVDSSKTAVTLADPEHLYVLRLRGSPLSDGTVTAKFNADNTLQDLSVTSTSKGQDLLAAAGQGVKDLADAKATRAKAASDKSTAADTATSSAEDLRLTALQAKQAAELAQAQLDALSASASAVDRLTAQQSVAKLKLAANQAARRAQEPLPYADVGT